MKAIQMFDSVEEAETYARQNGMDRKGYRIVPTELGKFLLVEGVEKS